MIAQVKEKLINLEQNFEKKSEKLKEMIEAINVTLRETIAKLEAENAKLKTKLVFSKPSYENITSGEIFFTFICRIFNIRLSPFTHCCKTKFSMMISR